MAPLSSGSTHRGRPTTSPPPPPHPPTGGPLVLLLFFSPGSQSTTDPDMASREILSAQHQDPARSLLAELRRLMGELNVLRGQVLYTPPFGQSASGSWRRSASFHAGQMWDARSWCSQPCRARVGRAGRPRIANHSDGCGPAARHVKRGLCLRTRPGKGKTLLVRHAPQAGDRPPASSYRWRPCR